MWKIAKPKLANSSCILQTGSNNTLKLFRAIKLNIRKCSLTQRIASEYRKETQHMGNLPNKFRDGKVSLLWDVYLPNVKWCDNSAQTFG